MTGKSDRPNLFAARGEIVEHLKRHGPSSIAELAARLRISGEAVRRQLIALEAEGWLHKSEVRRNPDQPGRPVTYYSLTNAGEHLFPRHYDALALELFRTVQSNGGDRALRELLAALVEKNVRRWEPELAGVSLEKRLEKLVGFYGDADEFMALLPDDGPGPCLVERNCPYQNVAQEFPKLCSVTINTLTRLTGHRVRREKKFQAGDRRCVFRVLVDQPIDPRCHTFEFEADESETRPLDAQRRKRK